VKSKESKQSNESRFRQKIADVFINHIQCLLFGEPWPGVATITELVEVLSGPALQDCFFLIAGKSMKKKD
jgi:hypothetical protein